MHLALDYECWEKTMLDDGIVWKQISKHPLYLPIDTACNGGGNEGKGVNSLPIVAFIESTGGSKFGEESPRFC